MKMKKVVSAISALLLLVMPFLFVKASSDLTSQIAPNFGPAPTEQLLVSDITTGSKPLILPDRKIVYEAQNQSTGHNAIFIKDLQSGSNTLVSDNAKHPSSFGTYFSYDSNGNETSEKRLYYAKYVNSTNGYDIYQYNLRTSTETVVVAGTADSDFPVGYSDANGTNIFYLDKDGSGTAALRKGYIQAGGGGATQSIIVSGLTDTAKILYLNNYVSSGVIYEKDGDLRFYNLQNLSDSVRVSGAYNPTIGVGNDLIYEKNDSGNKNIYLYDATRSATFTIADSSVDEYNPGDSVQGGVPYLVNSGSHNKVVVKRYYRDSNNTICMYSTLDISSDSRQITNVNGSYNYYIWSAASGSQTNIYGFNAGLLDRYKVTKGANRTIWIDGSSILGSNVKYYEEQSSSLGQVTLPDPDRYELWYYSDGENLLLNVHDIIPRVGNYNNQDLYSYDFATKQASLLYPHNDNYHYDVAGIADGKALIRLDDFTSGSVTSYMIYNFTTRQTTAITSIPDSSYVEAFDGNYVVFRHNNGNGNNYDLVLLDLSTNTQKKIVDNHAPVDGRGVYYVPGEMDSFIGDNKVVWSDTKDIFVYDISAGSTVKLDTEQREGYVKVKPQFSDGIVVWQDEKYDPNSGGGMTKRQSLLASLFVPQQVMAASNNYINVYNIATKALLGVFSTNDTSSNTDVTLASKVLYYSDTSSNGVRTLYQANITLASAVSQLTSLPNTGIVTILYFMIASSVGYLAYRTPRVFQKKKVWER